MKKVKSLLSDVILLFLPAEEGAEHELALGFIAGQCYLLYHSNKCLFKQ